MNNCWSNKYTWGNVFLSFFACSFFSCHSDLYYFLQLFGVTADHQWNIHETIGSNKVLGLLINGLQLLIEVTLDSLWNIFNTMSGNKILVFTIHNYNWFRRLLALDAIFSKPWETRKLLVSCFTIAICEKQRVSLLPIVVFFFLNRLSSPT